MNDSTTYNTAVIGGGIAGLTAAVLIARGGKSVVLYERSAHLGGRAGSQVRDGFVFNQGPHALYCSAGGLKVLRGLGVGFSGQAPEGKGRWMSLRGKLYTLPTGVASLMLSQALSITAKLEFGGILIRLGRLDVARWNDVSLGEWLDREVKHQDARQLVAALCRLSTYDNAPALQSAGASLRQVQIAMRGGVLYLDNGWQTLVDELHRIAAETQVQLELNQPVHQVQPDEDGWKIVVNNDNACRADSVVLAVAPGTAAALTSGPAGEILAQWAKGMVSVEVASLDVGLKRAPRPEYRFALGIDCPFYFSLQSAWARLAPEGGALIHAAKYLNPNEVNDAKAIERELEDWLESIQPGWRAELVVRRYLPKMRVYNAAVVAGAGGLAGRPGPAVPGTDNLFVAGDWVGSEGLLADAALLSAKCAAELSLRRESLYLAENVRLHQ